MTRQSEADRHAAVAEWLAEHPVPPRAWNPVSEERMAAAADGRRLRDLPTDRAVRAPSARDRRDEAGFLSRDGGFSWTWEPSE